MELVHEEGSLGSAFPSSIRSSSVPSGVEALPAGRVRYLVFPREHGAWGMLLVPLLTGGILGLRTGHDLGSLALLIAACLSLFCLRTPLENLVGVSPYRARTAGERRVAILAISGYGVLALSCAAALMIRIDPIPLLVLGN